MTCLPNDLTLLVGGKTSAAWPPPRSFASGAAHQHDYILFALFVVYRLLFASSGVFFVITRSVCGGVTFASSRAMAH